jgi:Carboxypeptidase regulatory-like domain
MRFRWIVNLGFLMAAGATTVAAQTDRATLEGTVFDASGAVVAGAKIEIVAVATDQRQERQSTSVGAFRFSGIAIGDYKVTVSHAGFQTIEFTDIVVQVGETRTVDVHLVVGATETRVEVRATSTDIERTSAESGTVIGQDQIGNLPINGRNWATLTILSPWAQDDGGGDQRTIRFAGRAQDDNNFTLDGADATRIQEQAQKSQVRLQISEDAIAEYRVASALYTADYGAGAGGQINVVTKSGSNDFHGTLYEYLRNSVFDARQFLDPSPVPPFRLNQYGLTVGGPLVKDKTFFFLNYEGLRQFQGQTLVAPVPNPALQLQVLTASPQLCPVIQAYP